MTDTEIGYIDYSTMNVDKNASYDSLKDRVVVITGAGQAIGRGYAHYFSAQGAIPVIADINGENAEAVAAEITDSGGRALGLRTDVANQADVTALADAALSEFGRIDCLINNAAVFSKITMAPFWELPVDEWKAAMDVNITGAFYCSRAVVPAMQEARWGRIINTTSGTVKTGPKDYLHYVTSKAAVIGMTRSMARELGDWNITVNTFWPGVTDTGIPRPSVPPEMWEKFVDMQVVKRSTRIEDLAKPMLFICSDEASYISGQILEPDGGLNFG